ncbi:MAG: response regulator [Planctomycetota bacterium]|nr:response regulator [Planctomycetota bacterium]MCZ6697707.1 response regulator [Planctomycetota bacterium]MCZ6817825.1 response regulator [Planctomycetota bacterium]
MGTKKILVCDDEPHIVHVVAAKLRNAGFEVLTASDGAEALSAAQQHRPDLVITDYQMPFLSGLELCTKLREDENLCDTPAIMLTARGFSLGDGVLEGTNVRRLLAKPFSPRAVLEAVKEILDESATAAASSTGESQA